MVRTPVETGIRRARALAAAVFATAALVLAAAPASAQNSLQGYALKIFRVEPALYPFVQVYFRTFDQNKEPLINLNELNVGLMVGGRSYNPTKMQYRLESIKTRREAIRSILILDASISMKGRPFDEAVKAAARYIDSKRPQDQVALIAIRDTKEGYEIVSNFERDPGALGRRLADVRCDGQRTRLYDTIGAAMQMAGMPSQGGGDDNDYIVSTSIVVFSDGKDEGSALSREELNGRITSLEIPIPIYSIAYTKMNREYFKNLESISKNSFGIYYEIGEAMEKMQRTVESIQNILQSDYVLTFRSYVPVDGAEHNFKLGVEYPSKSGKFTYQSSKFEAIEPPPVPALTSKIAALDQMMKKVPDGNPYFDAQPAGAPAPGAN